MKYKAVIFDFDGTLADTFPWVSGIMAQLAEKFNFQPFNEQEIDQLRGHGASKIIQSRKVPLWKVPLIARHVRKLMAGEIASIRMFEGAETTLHQLAGAGIQLAVVTSNALHNVQHVLGPRNSALIQAYECGANVFGKQAKFKKVLRKFGLPPTQVLCIGDEVRDMQAARKVGLPFGAVAWGYTHLEVLAACQPAEFFYEMADIVNALLPVTPS